MITGLSLRSLVGIAEPMSFAHGLQAKGIEGSFRHAISIRLERATLHLCP